MTAVAVIGLGGIGRLHARTLATEPGDAELAAVVDARADVAAAAAAQLGTTAGLSYDDVLTDAGVDAVVIATPTPTHADMVERAAMAGKHVFCEKPLSLGLADGRRAVEAARARGVCLQVGFQRRFDRDFRAAKACIDSGELGTIGFVRIAHRNRMPPHSDGLVERLGSIFVDMAIHDFDAVRWLVGEIAELDACAASETAVVTVRLDGGALGVIDNMRRAGYFECSVEVVGSESTIRFGAGASPTGIEWLTPAGRRSDLAMDYIARHAPAYRDELRHFLACVRSGKEPDVGGDDSLEALRLSLLAERCAG